MKPHGAIVRLTTNLQQISQFEGLEELEAFMASEECRRLLILASPAVRKSYERARERCLSGKPAPKVRRALWDDRMKARLAESMQEHDGDMDLMARDLHITVEAVRVACWRHLGVRATEKPSRKPQESHGARMPSASVRFANASPGATAGVP